MENIVHWKQRGNEFFKLKDFLKAINCWEEALQVIKEQETDLQSMVQKHGDQAVTGFEQIQKKLEELKTAQI